MAELLLGLGASLLVASLALGLVAALVSAFPSLRRWRDPWLAALLLSLLPFVFAQLPRHAPTEVLRLTLPTLGHWMPAGQGLAQESAAAAVSLPLPALLLCVWFLGAAWQLWGLWRRNRALKGLLGQCQVVPAEGELARHLGVDAPPPGLKLLLTDARLSHFACGRNGLVLSRWAPDKLELEQLRLVVAHELSHLRHGDPLLVQGLSKH
ncbi:hypothetical protein PVT67_07850 [Gallaecimonas kandeliae]|uniref:hypothetical protein n=1 Tax=Gallaecimonas kandeliae TaxID=3029055 RepID=UPI002649459F|nr:hypothetical protein [Gallaecimonas kandeliae]WKE67138.1 hypothetical protein PVT67_07850 [Gallaecimonas kandeliae]